MDEATYREMLAGYPEVGQFAYLQKVGHKYSLSEKYNHREYHQLVRSQPIWREFHSWIKSDAFVAGVIDALRAHHIDLGYGKPPSTAKRAAKLVKNLGRGRLGSGLPRLGARFEFSMLPVDGGHVIPHTDSPGKIITLVISIVDDDEWDASFGGGTDVNRPRDPHLAYNELNRQARFEDMDVIDTFEFSANQGVIFVKTFNSWHSVRPMTGKNADAMRRTLTINIEAD